MLVMMTSQLKLTGHVEQMGEGQLTKKADILRVEDKKETRTTKTAMCKERVGGTG